MKLRKFIMGWFSSDEIITNTASSSSSIEDKFVAGALSVIAILLIFIVICKLFHAYYTSMVKKVAQQEVRLNAITSANA